MSDPQNTNKPNTQAVVSPADLGKRLAELASENAIPLDADHDLTGRLARVSPPDQIPEKVYSGVAALLAFLRDAEEEAGD